MACPAVNYSGFRPYRRPSIRAKFQRHRNNSEENLREAIRSAKEQQEHVRSAEQQQRHVLCSTSSWHSGVSKCDDGYSIAGAHAMLRNHSNMLRPSWLSTSTCSSSNIQQNAGMDTSSTADLASPNLSYEDAMTSWFPNEKWQPQPMAKLERRPAKREAKRFEKDTRKAEKEAKKMQKAQQKEERKELHRRVTEARARNTTERPSTNADRRPEIDGDESKSPASTTVHAWKRPLLKLTTHSRRSKQIIPMPGDFPSKSDLQAYLNPVREDLSIPQIPELPAGPPPYNPLESSDLPDPNKTSDPPIGVSLENSGHLIQQTVPFNDARHINCEASPRLMLCDACNSGIGLSDTYYHCDKCNGGDRIVCSVCAEAGRRCRHGPLPRITSAKKAATAKASRTEQPQFTTPTETAQASCNADTTAANAPHEKLEREVYTSTPHERVSPDGDQVFAAANAELQSFEAFQRAIAMFRELKINDDHEKPRIKEDLLRTQKELLNRQQEVSRREQELLLREKEATLRERESALREEQACLRERETLFRERHLEERGAAVQPTVNTVALGASDVNKKGAIDAVRDMVVDLLTASFPRVYAANTHIRTHAQPHAGTKRKAPSETSHSRASSANTNQFDRDENGSNEKDEEESENEEGTPKRRKQTSGGPPTTSQRLLACPYAKCDPIRYSERNAHEKHYRGCSGRYLTDISRLKQHLYRVHQRPEHACPRCFDVFTSKQILDLHARQRILCQVAECQFEEKFTEDKMKELKRKRPGKSVEESWYIIFKILFPEAPPPDSPYVDDLSNMPLVEPSMFGVDTQTSNLLEIFNQQLSQHENAELVSSEARDLINQTLAQSMAELLRRISPTNTPGRTPSILVSPTSAQPRSNLQTPASSAPPSPLHVTRRNVPWLSPLQTDLAPPKRSSLPQAEPNSEIYNPPRRSPSPIKEEDHHQLSDVNRARASSSDIVLPDIGELQQWLSSDDYDYNNTIDNLMTDQLAPSPSSPPFVPGTERAVEANQKSIGLAISELGSFDFGFQGSLDRQADTDVHSGSTFVPVKVSSLDDLEPVGNTDGDANATSLKMTSSKRSLDSGYGSMHSRLGSTRVTDSNPTYGQPEPEVPTAVDVNADLAYLNHGLYETLAQPYRRSLDLDLDFDVEYGSGSY